MPTAISLLSGAVAAGYAVIATYFFRFWTDTRDALFLNFAIAFGLFCANQVLTGIYGGGAETSPAFFLLRLTGFLCLAFAVARKNLSP